MATHFDAPHYVLGPEPGLFGLESNTFDSWSYNSEPSSHWEYSTIEQTQPRFLENKFYDAVQQGVSNSSHSVYPGSSSDSVTANSDDERQVSSKKGGRRMSKGSRQDRECDRKVKHKVLELKRRQDINQCISMFEGMMPPLNLQKPNKVHILLKAVEYMSGLKQENEQLRRRLFSYSN